MNLESNCVCSPKFPRRSYAVAIAFALIVVLLGSSAAASSAWSNTDTGGSSSITINACKGDVGIVDQYGNRHQLEDGNTATFDGEVSHVIRIEGELHNDDAINVTVASKDGPMVEDPSLFVGTKWFRDISFTGIDKEVEIGEPNASLSLLANTKSSPSESRPEVGDVFNGKCSVSSTHKDSSGTVDGATCVITTGILKEVSPLLAFCADHTAAAPYVGQQFTYTFTITSVNKKTGKVVGSFYATPVNEPTDGTTTDSSGLLTGYQRLSIKAELSRSYAGYIRIKKVSAMPEITSSNSLYSLDGATYRIYEDKNCKTRSEYADIVTKQGVYVKSDAIDAGTYYVKETKAPKGFELSDKVYKVVVEPDETVDVGVEVDGKTVIVETPRHNPSEFVLGKLDNDSNEGSPQGDSSLQGAQYTVEYYDGQYTNVASIKKPGNPKRQWAYSSDANGKINMCNESYLVSGNLYKDENDNVIFPLGTYLIYEAKAPTGYVLSDEKVLVRIMKDTDSNETVFQGNLVKGNAILGSSTIYSNYANVVPLKEPPIKGSLKIEKRDLETKELQPLGKATLEGTQFKITNRSKSKVIIDGCSYQPNEVCATIYTNKEGIASMPEKSLPYGTYSLRETAASNGYMLTDIEERTFTIREDGELAFYGNKDEEGATKKGDAFYNPVIRGDLTFVKVRGDTAERLANIPFEIISKTTGERHVVVTDENGEVKTESGWNPHTENTNANDSFDDNSIVAYSGSWWGVTSSGIAAIPNDDLGALVFDDYELKELPTAGNRGLELVSFDFSILRDKRIVSLGTIENNPPSINPNPSITTIASDALDGDKIAYASSKCKLVDQVSYMNLAPHETYTLRTTLLDVDTLQQIPGAEATLEFTPNNIFGSVAIELECNTLTVAGKEVVFFEEVLLGDDVICEHKDAEDASQKVTIAKPEVDTYAHDSHDADKTIVSDSKSSVTDDVTLRNLESNVSYTLYGIVMDSNECIPAITKADSVKSRPTQDELNEFWSGLLGLLNAKTSVSDDGYSCDIEYNSIIDKTAIEQYINAHPKVVEAIDIVSKQIVATSDSMTTSLDYSVSSSELNGDYVIFDLLLNDDNVVAVHADTGNADQSFQIVQPTLATTATDKTDNDHYILPSKDAKVIDVVEYCGLVSGAQYEIMGTLMNKKDGKALYINDKLVEATTKFTPNSQTGTVEICFSFDASSLDENTSLVAFERLKKDGKQIAEHADIDSESQTVRVSLLHGTNIPQKALIPESGYYKTGYMSKESSMAMVLLLLAITFSVTTFKLRQKPRP